MSPANPREKLPPHVSDLHTRARRRRFKIFCIGGAVLFLFLSVGGWWFFIRSDVFRFKAFDVQGNTRLTDEEVISLLEERVVMPTWKGKIFGSDHYFSWPKGVDANFLHNLGNIQRVSFSRDLWNHRLTITVEEHQFFAILCARKNDPPQCVWFDKDGLFFEDAFFSEGVLVLRVDDYTREKVNLGEYFYSAEKLKNALSVFEVIHDLNLPAASWSIRQSAPENIEVQLIDGPVLYFNLSFPSDYTAQVIRSLIGQKGMKNLQYIDFRVQGRAYYKDGSASVAN